MRTIDSMRNPFRHKPLLEEAKAIPLQLQLRKKYATEQDLDEYLDAIIAWLNGDIKSVQLAKAVSRRHNIARTSVYSFVLSVLLSGIESGKIVIRRPE